MKTIVKDLYLQVKSLYGQSLVTLERIEQNIMGLLKTPDAPDGYLSIENQVDYVFALRETEELLERMLKNVKKVKRLASKQACITCVMDTIEKVETEYCTGKLNEKFAFVYPNRRRENQENYDTLMEALGIPVDVYSKELVRIHYPAFQAYCNELVSAGYTTPAGIDPNKQIPDYDFAVRRRKGVEISADEPIKEPEEEEQRGIIARTTKKLRSFLLSICN